MSDIGQIHTRISGGIDVAIEDEGFGESPQGRGEGRHFRLGKSRCVGREVGPLV